MMARRIWVAMLVAVGGLFWAVPSAYAHLCPYSASPLVIQAANETFYVSCSLQSHRWQGYDPVPNPYVFVGVYRETNGTEGLQTPWTSDEPDSVVFAEGAMVQPDCPSIWYIDNPVNWVLYGVCAALPEI